MYSNPPRHGAEIVSVILTDDQLYSQWKVRIRLINHHCGKPVASMYCIYVRCARRSVHEARMLKGICRSSFTNLHVQICSLQISIYNCMATALHHHLASLVSWPHWCQAPTLTLHILVLEAVHGCKPTQAALHYIATANAVTFNSKCCHFQQQMLSLSTANAVTVNSSNDVHMRDVAGRVEGHGRQDHHNEGEAACSPEGGGSPRHMGPHHQPDWHVLLHRPHKGLPVPDL